jgi:predicted metal-dependent HD superfamily phosphohydrolase
MRSFQELIHEINPKCDLLLRAITEDFILRSYNEHFRRYHNYDNHILPGLLILQDKNVSSLCKNSLLVELAWWYHDVVYVPGGKVNERASAERALFDCTTLGLTEPYAQTILGNKEIDIANYVAFLVYITDHSKIQATNDNDANILLDLDLSILGSQPNDYFSYAAAIRQEYKHIGIKNFLDGRIAFLRDMTNKQEIFKTQYFQDRFEKQARENIKLELESLTK